MTTDTENPDPRQWPTIDIDELLAGETYVGRSKRIPVGGRRFLIYEQSAQYLWDLNMQQRLDARGMTITDENGDETIKYMPAHEKEQRSNERTIHLVARSLLNRDATDLEAKTLAKSLGDGVLGDLYLACMNFNGQYLEALQNQANTQAAAAGLDITQALAGGTSKDKIAGMTLPGNMAVDNAAAAVPTGQPAATTATQSTPGPGARLAADQSVRPPEPPTPEPPAAQEGDPLKNG